MKLKLISILTLFSISLNASEQTAQAPTSETQQDAVEKILAQRFWEHFFPKIYTEVRNEIG